MSIDEVDIEPEREPLRLDARQLARFVSKIQIATVRPEYGECYIWTGTVNEKGYGRFYVGKKADGKSLILLAHRVAFEHYKQELILPGYIVDHECSHKGCVRHEHLKQVGMVENLRLANERRPWKRRNQYSER